MNDVDAFTRRCETEMKSFIREKMPQMQASHARANLLSIPAELRNRIYELVLIADDGIERPDGSYMIELADPSEESSYDDHGMDECVPDYFSTPGWCKQPPLTRVSRQIRAETLPMYYSNTFVVYVEGAPGWLLVEGARAWFRSMPDANHRLLKDLHVRFCVNSSTCGLSGERMARVLQQLGVDVSEGAVTSWVAPSIRYVGRGEVDDWQLVRQPVLEHEEREQDEVEDAFSEEIVTAIGIAIRKHRGERRSSTAG